MQWLANHSGEPYGELSKIPAVNTKSQVFRGTVRTHAVNVTERSNSATKENGFEHIESYEYWSGAAEKEARHMTVPTAWLESEGLAARQLKSIEMPDDSQADRIRKGDFVAINVDWDGTLKTGEVYAIMIGGQYTLRRVVWQANGQLLLRCKNPEYPDSIIESSDVSKLDVIGQFALFQGRAI